jgi:hypothetical protein
VWTSSPDFSQKRNVELIQDLLNEWRFKGACKATEAKWIQIAGKPNKDFLAKPMGAHKRYGSMTIDNFKDQPDLPGT